MARILCTLFGDYTLRHLWFKGMLDSSQLRTEDGLFKTLILSKHSLFRSILELIYVALSSSSLLFFSFSPTTSKYSELVSTLAPEFLAVVGLDGILTGSPPKNVDKTLHLLLLLEEEGLLILLVRSERGVDF